MYCGSYLFIASFVVTGAIRVVVVVGSGAVVTIIDCTPTSTASATITTT